MAINEELIFRAIFISNSNYKTKLTTIIVSAAVFGVCHLTNFLSTFNPASLLMVVYTFLLGLMLGCIYVFTGSYIFVASLHFSFNLLNDVLFEALVPNVTNIWFYLLSNTIVTLFVAAYLVIIYLKKKGEK